MTDSIPNNLLHVSATRVASSEDAVEPTVLPEAEESSSQVPMRDFESLALISQEMNKEHRYLADKRAQMQTSNSFYQLAGGAAGGAGSLAYFLDKNSRFRSEYNNKYQEVVSVFEKHFEPFHDIRSIKEIRNDGSAAAQKQIQEKASILLKHYCEPDKAEKCEALAIAMVEKITDRTLYQNVLSKVDKELRTGAHAKSFVKNMKSALNFLSAAQSVETSSFVDDGLEANTNKVSEYYEALDDMFENSLKPALDRIGLKDKALEKAKDHFYKKTPLLDIRNILKEDIGRTLDKTHVQTIVGAGAIIASATLGGLAYSFLNNKGHKNIKASERKLDALGDAFELYNAPNTKIEASEDVAHEKLDEAEHVQSSSHSV